MEKFLLWVTQRTPKTNQFHASQDVVLCSTGDIYDYFSWNADELFLTKCQMVLYVLKIHIWKKCNVMANNEIWLPFSIFHFYFNFFLSTFTYKIRDDLEKTIEQIIVQIIRSYGKVMTISSEWMICEKLAHQFRLELQIMRDTICSWGSN